MGALIAGMVAMYFERSRPSKRPTLLGNTYFGRQEYDAAITNFTKATGINPSFSQPYNQLGYAYRFLEKFDDAEKAFKKYTQLIPGDPNPYDSYAELLMKVARFDESIKMYEKALSLDPNFIASHIANQQDPRILYFLALASKAAGDSARAATFATKAANFNGLNFNYGYVRAKARKLSAT
jgi:tetratricopeptide (TPR) repeat protein